MKTKGICFITIVFLMGMAPLFLPPVLAQNTLQGATFDTTLETLRQSVARVARENQEINARNLAMRAKIKLLNERLRSLQAESSRLEAKRSDMMIKVGRSSGGIDAMKEQLARTEEELHGVRRDKDVQYAQFKSLQDEERLAQEKIVALNEDIMAIRGGGPGAAPVRQDILQARQDQASLQAQLQEAVRNLQAATKEWQDLDTLVTTGPQQLAVLKNDHERLQKALAQAEADLARDNARLPEAQAEFDKILLEDYSAARAQGLESDVKDMAERNQKLEEEIAAIQKSRGEGQARQSLQREHMRKELEAKHDEFFQRNKALRQQLDELRREMVDLDKKKAALEAGIYPKD